MSELLSSLRQAGLSELACQFARFIQRLDKAEDDLVAMTAALLSDAVSQGHVCLNLFQFGEEHVLATELPEKVSDWITRLKQSNVVGQSGDYAPLILTDEGLLYLYRHWQDEQFVAQAIQHRCQSVSVNNSEQCQQDFADWNNDIDGIDWQKVAVFMALTRPFSVISGGPGTGKTTIVLRLLHMLFNQDSELRIAVAAPTGKAAARLQQVITNDGNATVEAKTLHRLLGITAENDQGRYNQQRPMSVDIVIVDEASMIDISLMAILMKALPNTARLILLGDSQQLASVESGAVLANLCGQLVQFTDEFCNTLELFTDIKLDHVNEQNTTLIDSVAILQHSYRFDQQSDIGQLAIAIRQGDDQSVFNVLTSSNTPIWHQQLDQNTIWVQVSDGYQAYLEAVIDSSDAATCLRLFEQYRVLCALKHGPQSVVAINTLIERQLSRQGWRTNQRFYRGRPIMVTKNDYRQQLFNGDVGLVLHNELGEMQACFLFENSIRWVDLARLPEHETAFAMTIHKSQGSEFDEVCVLLPEEQSPLLNRELLYTAITRAKKRVTLLATEDVLMRTVITQHQRESGLAKLLEKKSDA